MTKSKNINTCNNGWYSIRDENSVVVFIHGFLSDSKKCWTAKNGTYWPDLLVKDEVFKNPSVFLGGYHTSIDSGGYDIVQCTAELRDSLELKNGNSKPPIDFQNILFVCHSLGGIICRRLLEESSSRFRGKSIGILLVASPSIGSIYADGFSGLANLYGNQIGRQLKTDGEILKDIDNRFRNLIKNHPFHKFVGAEMCEQHGPIRIKFLPFRLKPIVDTNSASKYFGQVRMIAETDHASIAKPDSKTHKSHNFLQHFYQKDFEPIEIRITIKNSQEKKISHALTNPDPLFEVYSRSHECFYVNRALDETLVTQLKAGSVWVFGSSGVGKTSSAKYAIDKISNKTTEIHLGHIDEKCTQEQILIEIICALNPDETSEGSNLHQKAIQLLKERSQETVIPIFLDEVPISSGSSHSVIANTLANLLDSIKQTHTSNVNFLISSISCPPLVGVTPKMRERIHFLEVEKWTKKEIENLFDLISKQLNICSQVHDIKNDVVTCSRGLPRFIKAFFRIFNRQSISNRNSELALIQANQEVGNFI